MRYIIGFVFVTACINTQVLIGVAQTQMVVCYYDSGPEWEECCRVQLPYGSKVIKKEKHIANAYTVTYK